MFIAGKNDVVGLKAKVADSLQDPRNLYLYKFRAVGQHITYGDLRAALRAEFQELGREAMDFVAWDGNTRFRDLLVGVIVNGIQLGSYLRAELFGSLGDEFLAKHAVSCAAERVDRMRQVRPEGLQR